MTTKGKYTSTGKRVRPSGEAGLIRRRVSRITRNSTSVYVAVDQGIDVGPDKYAVVCDTHSTLVGAATVADAKAFARSGEFCEYCMTGVRNEPRVPRATDKAQGRKPRNRVTAAEAEAVIANLQPKKALPTTTEEFVSTVRGILG